MIWGMKSTVKKQNEWGFKTHKIGVTLFFRTKISRCKAVVGSEEKFWVLDISAWVDNPDGTMRWKPSTSYCYHSKRKPNVPKTLLAILQASGLIDWEEQKS